ncbi:alkyl/aryl-sulfatase [Streptomyces beijiangensis]|uniref:MBL fold metallo-hydrolase n=1 Tax=Streptomyces beijiangensis TaxID=163361 RepID=A0A939F3W2_9ACTN|nr:alkyl sulfatase dimerization domain-containing protein [Streptomyces beijiangensis]MBO0512076.1 MBL fold metallo-hydrolase [Streptomyces beijiangensis]
MSTLPSFTDTTDFDNADRGLVASLKPGVVTNAEGRVIYDSDAYAFLSAECPDTAHPSLWRQAQLASKQGLYEVTDGIYQVRGLDLSNMTLVEGDTGVIVIDPLISTECAAAALALYREHRGKRPVTGVIYTHCHGDHFGGVRGVLPEDPAGIPILAPEGFLEHAVAENVYAGNAMTRRAIFMYGDSLAKAPEGQIGAGLGMTTSTGTMSLVPPTVDITHTGQEETVDGVRIVFQVTPGTEAPSEMNFHFPDRRALCMAENATHNMHNILTLRGAVVRDSRVWAHYLDEAIGLFGEGSDVAFASHHWPTWGKDAIVTFLAQQRDLYAYMHDQTLRLLNAGYTGLEIAEEIQLPPALETSWHARGYYGSLSHNVKAIYQRYMGWYDGNPSHLWEHPPVDNAKRYVDCMGGTDAVVTKAGTYTDTGDLRFAATLLGHAVFADPDHTGARDALAAVYTKLGHGSENGTWRNFYLTGAKELKTGPQPITLDMGSPEMSMALTIEQLIDSLAVRVNGPRAWDLDLTVDWIVTDLSTRHRLTLSNGALTHLSYGADTPVTGDAAPLTLTLTKPQLLGMLGGRGLEGITTNGNPQVLGQLMSVLDEPDKAFAIVTP